MPYFTDFESFNRRIFSIKDVVNENLLSNISITTNGQDFDLIKMRDNAEKNVRGLLNALGYNGNDIDGSLEKLNKRIQHYQSVSSIFNGVQLRTKVINPLKGVVVDDIQTEAMKFRTFMKEKSNEIENAFTQVVNTIVGEIINDPNVDNPIVTAASEIVGELNAMTFTFSINGSNASPGKGGGKRVDTKTIESLKKKIIEGIKRNQYDGSVDPGIRKLIQTNPDFTRRLLLLAQARGITVEGLYEESKNIPPVVEIKETSDGISIYTDILKPFTDVMDPYNGKKAEKAAFLYFDRLPPDKKEQEIQKLINRAKEFFSTIFNTSDVSDAAFLQSKFDAALERIIREYPAALFTGRNDQGVIGILGEIQSLYYIYCILGENKPSIAPETLAQWVGGNTEAAEDNVKPGADIILRGVAENMGYGIQIKNSMDLTRATSFSDFTLYQKGGKSFNQQMIDFGIEPDVVNAIEDIFVMQSFNISYHLMGRIAVEGSPKGINADVYLKDYDELGELAKLAQRFMALAAVMIMRIQYLEGQGFEQNNTLWIVGGSAVVSAVQILNDLIQQINGKLDGNIFKTVAKTFLDDKKYTIVDYLNAEKKPDVKNLKTTIGTSYNFHNVS